MLVSVDVPDRYEKRSLFIFAGLEPVARSEVRDGMRGPWEVKLTDCVRCGRCCQQIREDHPLGGPDGCIHLRRSPGEQLCGMGVFRPFGCAIADGGRVGIEDCAVTWGAVE